MRDALLVETCHLRAIDLGRRLAGSGGSQPKRDVMDERNHKAGRVEVRHLEMSSAMRRTRPTCSPLTYCSNAIPTPSASRSSTRSCRDVARQAGRYRGALSDRTKLGLRTVAAWVVVFIGALRAATTRGNWRARGCNRSGCDPRGCWVRVGRAYTARPTRLNSVDARPRGTFRCWKARRLPPAMLDREFAWR
jgi:hypothetical protein